MSEPTRSSLSHALAAADAFATLIAGLRERINQQLEPLDAYRGDDSGGTR